MDLQANGSLRVAAKLEKSEFAVHAEKLSQDSPIQTGSKYVKGGVEIAQQSFDLPPPPPHTHMQHPQWTNGTDSLGMYEKGFCSQA